MHKLICSMIEATLLNGRKALNHKVWTTCWLGVALKVMFGLTTGYWGLCFEVQLLLPTLSSRHNFSIFISWAPQDHLIIIIIVLFMQWVFLLWIGCTVECSWLWVVISYPHLGRLCFCFGTNVLLLPSNALIDLSKKLGPFLLRVLFQRYDEITFIVWLLLHKVFLAISVLYICVISSWFHILERRQRSFVAFSLWRPMIDVGSCSGASSVARPTAETCLFHQWIMSNASWLKHHLGFL